MKVTQEKLPDSQIGLEIEVSPETSKNTYEKMVQDLARSSNIPGFRKGKVPRQILLQRIGAKKIRAAALEELIQKSLEEAIEQESIESLGNYKLLSSFDDLIEQYKPGNPLTFSASVDISPEVKLGEYKGLIVKAEETLYDGSQVDDALEEQRVKQATLVPVEDRPAQMGDVVVVDYEGRFAEVEEEEQLGIIPGTQATDYQLELSEGQLIEGMVEGIVGMKLEELKEVDVSFSQDYPAEELAGEDVVFSVTLKELKEKELPELDDDFAEEVSEFETIEQLRESLETRFKENAERETKNSIHSAIIKKLLEQTSIDLPETMIQKEVDHMVTQTAMEMSNLGIDIRKMFTSEVVSRLRERSRPEAIENIKESLILTEIGNKEAIEVEPEVLKTKIEEIKKQLSDQSFDEDKLKKVVADDLLKEKILDWLQEQAEVELVPEGSLSETEDESAEALEAAPEEMIAEDESAKTIEVVAQEIAEDESS